MMKMNLEIIKMKKLCLNNKKVKQNIIKMKKFLINNKKVKKNLIMTQFLIIVYIIQ